MQILITFYRKKEQVPGNDLTLTMLHHAGLLSPQLEMKEPVVMHLTCHPHSITNEAMAERVKNIFSSRYKNIDDLKVTFENGQTI